MTESSCASMTGRLQEVGGQLGGLCRRKASGGFGDDAQQQRAVFALARGPLFQRRPVRLLMHSSYNCLPQIHSTSSDSQHFRMHNC